MKPQLHRVTGKNRYCGPTAIATVCGITTDEASMVIRSLSGKRSVCFMSDLQMVDALRAIGCTVDYHTVSNAPTVNRWVRENERLFKEHHVILTHGRHYGTLLGDGFLCSLSGRMVVNLSDIPKRKARVASYFVVTGLPLKIGKISRDLFPIKVRAVPVADEVAKSQLDDSEASLYLSDRVTPLSQSDYYLLERAMQWPEDLYRYDQLTAQEVQRALPV